jgi:release factor glutamine methyltransferase
MARMDAASLQENTDALLRAAARRLAALSPSPRLDAELLLAHALGTSREGLYRLLRQPVPAAAAARFAALLAAREGQQPVAYLTGEREFWSLRLAVTPDVLVPRPETELLVERALLRIMPGSRARVLDLGTGSGAIALAVASERPLAQVLGTDRSEAALAVARGNATRLNISNTAWLESDWYAALAPQQFDLVVSNPPYIADDEWPATDPDIAFEPVGALRAGADGLDDLRVIIAAARDWLAPGGFLLVEHGQRQGAAVRALFAAAGLVDVGSEADLAGLERITEGRRPGTA